MITLHKLSPFPPTHQLLVTSYSVPLAAIPPATATLIMQQLCSSFMFEQVTNASNQLLTHILQYVQYFTKYESKAILWQLHTVGPCSYPLTVCKVS